MINPRFYGTPTPLSAHDITTRLMDICSAQSKKAYPPIDIKGDRQHVFEGVCGLTDAGPTHLSYYHKGLLKNVDYEDALKNTKAGGVFVKEEDAHLVPQSSISFIVLRPYRAFATAVKLFYPDKMDARHIHPTAVVHPSAVIGDHSFIGPYTVIGEGVTLGKSCFIDAHVTLTHCTLGDRVKIKPGARIGQSGFGFEMDEMGPIDMPQMGTVIIQDDVEIGANTCIDRGSFGDTVIGHGSRIDNMVQIAHNVKVGRNCVIVAQVGISGSTTLGNFVMAGGQAGLSGHLNIGDGARIAAQSGVMRDVPPKIDMGGSPALPARDWHKQTALLRRMIGKKDRS